jgi:hypothetical protein
MAVSNGDISAVKVLYRQTLSGGRNADGVGTNDKVLVVGEITALYVSTGIAVHNVGGANCFGVTNIDLLKLEAVTSGSTYTDARQISLASYDHENQKIFYVIDEGAADPADPADGVVVTLRFLCIGDAADAPVLT